VHEPGTVPPPPSTHPAASSIPTAPPEPPTFARIAAARSRKAEAPPSSADFPGRSARLAISNGRGVDLVDAATGQGVSISTHVPVTAVALSADESLAAVADEAGRVSLWDIRAGSLRHTWTQSAISLAFSADGKKLALGNEGLTVVDTESFAELLRDAELSSVFGIVFSPSGREVVAAAGNTTVRAYDIATRARTGGGEAQTGGTFGIAVSPDGRWAAAGAPDGHGLQVFDVHAWGPRQLVTIESCSEHVAPAFAKSGRYVYAHGGGLWVKGFEVGTFKPYASYRALPGREVASIADDLSRVVVTQEGRAPVVVTVETKAETKLQGAFEGQATYAMSADGLHVAGVAEGTARVWSAKTGQVEIEVVSPLP
jgi:WD40 repeat protein